MIPRSDLTRFAEVCSSISRQAADDTGFVAIRQLLRAFRADLHARPLLVEGMLTSIDPPGNATASGNRWAVLVDSDTYPVDDHAVAEETVQRVLPVRLRNTIAHELVHSLAFRPTEFGVRLSTQGKAGVSNAELVSAIEKETERLSPLLLLPDKAIENLIRDRTRPVDATALAAFARSMGVSRYVLVNRLNLLPAADALGLRQRPGLYRLGVGIGEWTIRGEAVFKTWPVFHNFERNCLPSFMATLIGRRQDGIAIRDSIPDDRFLPCGGTELATEFETGAGLPAAPNAERMRVFMTVEKTAQRPGSTFLYAVRGELVRDQRPAAAAG